MKRTTRVRKFIDTVPDDGIRSLFLTIQANPGFPWNAESMRRVTVACLAIEADQ